MFHVEQKEPGADREPTGSRQGADREPTGSRQGADRERKKKLDRKKRDRLGWPRSFDAFTSDRNKSEGEVSDCPLRDSETEPGRKGTIYYGSRD